VSRGKRPADDEELRIPWGYTTLSGGKLKKTGMLGNYSLTGKIDLPRNLGEVAAQAAKNAAEEKKHIIYNKVGKTEICGFM